MMRGSRLGFMLMLPVPVLLLSLLVGPQGSVPPSEIIAWLKALSAQGRAVSDPALQMVGEVVLNVRLPRIILAFLVGGALTVSGASLQALARNPLVAPDVVGLSAGAAFGAALAMSSSWLPLQPCAFVFGVLAAGLTYFLALNRGGVSIVSLILSGVIVGGIFTALLTIVQVLSDPFKLQTIVHWTMGNLHNATWGTVRSAAVPIAIGALVLLAMRWRMNVLALGDEETRAVGLNPEKEKLLVLVPAALVASASVAVAGVIGLVGLAVPHITRMLVGPDNSRTIPACLAFGGVFLVLVDDLARAVTSFELPIGIFTTLIGGPFFVYLLKRARLGFGE
ncbi:MAG TPA: iron ABC transporter permease [Deltaproteobacteria bacterium]|nr:iron ABC transporter permease [Deltaproteobacteria bacterium]